VARPPLLHRRRRTTHRVRRLSRRWLLGGVAWVAASGLLAGSAGPAVATGDEPIFIGWSSTLPPAVGSYEPSSADDCRAGRPQCLVRTLAHMRRHLRHTAASCDHDAVFALTYLRTTEEFGRAVEEPGFFEDPAFLHHWDAVFADYYRVAYEDWHAGRRADVPAAWRVALAAADDRTVSGSGNLLLGMSAHINRDLPFVLASIGQTAPDGSSRKPDHDKVNVFLNRVAGPIPAEAARRFDPTMDDATLPGGLTGTTFMQTVTAWREQAWRNAERLRAAPDEAARDRVAADIEAAAEAEARSILASTRYAPPVTSSAQRDAYCAASGG
jgi:hypothetical protein